MNFISIVNQFLAIVTILGQFFAVVLLVAILFPKITVVKPIREFIGQNGIAVVFLVSLTAMLGSLFYSEIARYTPCVLCWYQRILMYPLVLITGIALLKKYTVEVVHYVFWMSLFGFGIAAWHYMGQIGAISSLPCSAVGYSQSCAERFVMQFGYITIPLMAATAFAMIFLTTVLLKKLKNN